MNEWREGKSKFYCQHFFNSHVFSFRENFLFVARGKNVQTGNLSKSFYRCWDSDSLHQTVRHVDRWGSGIFRIDVDNCDDAKHCSVTTHLVYRELGLDLDVHRHEEGEEEENPTGEGEQLAGGQLRVRPRLHSWETWWKKYCLKIEVNNLNSFCGGWYWRTGVSPPTSSIINIIILGVLK